MSKILLTFVLLLALFLRVFKVGIIPATLYGDEQAFAYNAYSIMLTGKDEYGTAYPLEFRSFDDYKAPVPVYSLIPFINLFGLNAFAIRLPVVIASTLTVFVTYFLSRRLFCAKTALLAAYLLAISPWHIHLSRGYFESTIALLFFVLAIYLFVKKGNYLSKLTSVFIFTASLYTYFTPRILVPIFLTFLFLLDYFWSKRQSIKSYYLYIIVIVLLSFPLLHSTIFGKGFSRFQKLSESMNNQIVASVNRERNTSLLPQEVSKALHNKATVRLRMIKDNYLEHLSLNFWYIFGDNSLRYFTGNMGMFYIVELPFFVGGLWSMWQKNRRAAILFGGWILLAPIPAALVGRSYAVRSLAMLPAPFLFVAYGMNEVVKRINLRLRFYIFSGIVILFCVSLLLHQVKYYFEYPVYAATWWGWENKKAIDYAHKLEENYDNIFLSDFYTGMPLAFAVYNQIHPDVYRKALENPVVLADQRHLIQFEKYFIGSLDINATRLLSGIVPPKSLYIGRPEETPSEEIIRAPDDGRTLFYIYKTL